MLILVEETIRLHLYYVNSLKNYSNKSFLFYLKYSNKKCYFYCEEKNMNIKYLKINKINFFLELIKYCLIQLNLGLILGDLNTGKDES